jgi:hypothetical protein
LEINVQRSTPPAQGYGAAGRPNSESFREQASNLQFKQELLATDTTDTTVTKRVKNRFISGPWHPLPAAP